MATAVSSAVSYARENQKRFLDELKDLLRIPSVSTAEEHKADVRKAAEMVANDLKRTGFENVEIIPTNGHPLVYADWLHAAGKPTALCYAHYDVQPAEPFDEWKSPPFMDKDAVPRQGRQRASDQTRVERARRAQPEHLCARRGGRQGPALDAAQGLRVAVQGGRRQAAHQRPRADRGRRGSGRREHRGVRAKNANTGKLKSDFALVTDTELFAPDMPTLCVGLRGLLYTEIEAQGAKTDLHSGVYGGAAPNPLFALVEIISKLKDADGKILIPGFYDAVQKPTDDELKAWAQPAVRRRGVSQERSRVQRC